MIRRLWARLLRRPGIQRHTVVMPLPGYEAEERRILDEVSCRECPPAAPRRVPTGEHDRFPQMAEDIREVVVVELDLLWALPARERAS